MSLVGLPHIRTNRILLRPWTLEDVDALHALWTAPEVRLYLWDDVVIPLGTAEQVVHSHMRAVEQFQIGCWALHIPPSEATIAGFCGFRLIDGGPDIELLYGLQGTYWGKGLATEACKAALEYLWSSTHFHRVFARTDPPNQRSIRVMVRLGMTHESTSESMVTYRLDRPRSFDAVGNEKPFAPL